MDQIKVLDHGYVSCVETWGSDERIIEAARMSTAKGFQGWGPGGNDAERVQRFSDTVGALSGGNDHADRCTCQRQEVGPNADTPHKHYAAAPHACARCGCSAYVAELPSAGDEKLLAYLWKNKHATPFEMAGATFEVQAPIFVFREWHRHRVPFGYNEMSARYTPLPDVNYIPTVERLMLNAGGSNKQAGTIGGAQALTERTAEEFRVELAASYSDAEGLYQWALEAGIPKELARVHLPVGRYSRMRATSNLRGWLGFLALRMDKAAQYEIRMYANLVHDVLAVHFPRTLALFDEGRAA